MKTVLRRKFSILLFSCLKENKNHFITKFCTVQLSLHCLPSQSNVEECLRSICFFISRRDRLNWDMIHAFNLCFLFLYCQWLMRGNCKSSQREALLEGQRRIREGASKVGFTVQRLFVPLLVCLWLSKVASVRAWYDFQKLDTAGVYQYLWHPLLRTSQEWHLTWAPLSFHTSLIFGWALCFEAEHFGAP